jgi:hypothetical protein
MARSGIGTVIGRRSVSKQREYRRIWIYVPTKVSEDTNFPFKVGDPCSVIIDTDARQLIIKTISREKAVREGWRAKASKTD